MRLLLREACEQDELDAAELLVTELVTNAVLHASTPCRLRLFRRGCRLLRVEVTDASVGRVPRPDARSASGDPATGTGRGLLLVDALAVRWGVVPACPTGKTVWFEMYL